MESGKRLENIENLPIVIKTIGAEELIERIYKGESILQDPRFLPTEEGGVFQYFWINDLNNIYGNKGLFFPIIEVADKIVGLAKLEEQPGNSKNLWIKFISVDPEFQNRGYASQLMEEIFRFARENDKSLEASLYSKVGYERLKPKLRKLADKYGVQFIDIKEE